MSATKLTPRLPNKRRMRLKCTLHTASNERFLALPVKERDRILADYREACAPAFASVDDYIAYKRREAALDNEA